MKNSFLNLGDLSSERVRDSYNQQGETTMKTQETRIRSQLVSRGDEGGLVSTVLSLLSALVLIGLAIALYKSFDGDLLAILNWGWNWVIVAIEWVADAFAGNAFFQDAVK